MKLKNKRLCFFSNYLLITLAPVLICLLISSCATAGLKEEKAKTAAEPATDSIKLKGTFTLTKNGLTVNFYDEKNNLRATLAIDSADLSLGFKATADTLKFRLNEKESASGPSLTITENRFTLSLYDEKTKGSAVLTLTPDGLQLVIYDSLGKPVWGK